MRYYQVVTASAKYYYLDEYDVKLLTKAGVSAVRINEISLYEYSKCKGALRDMAK